MVDEQRERHWQRLKQRLENEPFWRLLGITVEEMGDGYACLRLPLAPQVRNLGRGPAHGGALSSLVDVAVGAALDSLQIPDMVGHTTVELSVSYLEPAESESVIAQGRIIRLGRHLAVGEAELRAEDGRLVAKGRATYLIWRLPAPARGGSAFGGGREGESKGCVDYKTLTNWVFSHIINKGSHRR